MGTAVVIDYIPGVPEEYRFGFGWRDDACLDFRFLPFIIFYAAPVVVAVAIDIVLFVVIVLLMRRMRSTSAESSNQPRVSFRTFLTHWRRYHCLGSKRGPNYLLQ